VLNLFLPNPLSNPTSSSFRVYKRFVYLSILEILMFLSRKKNKWLFLHF